MSATEAFYDLAPTDLPNYRVRRYQGDDMCVQVRDFTERDQTAVRVIYAYLLELLQVVSPHAESAGQVVESLGAFLASHSSDSLAEMAREFGRTSYATTPRPQLAKVIHDIRGGGLSPLIGQLQLAELGLGDGPAAHALYFLTRDHLKIMRNALLGLDDGWRQRDLLPKIHGTDLLVEKWHHATLRVLGRDVRLELECPHQIEICESCVEFGAVDRILYNLIGNACRHSVDAAMRLIVLPMPKVGGDNVRFILLNEVCAEDTERLRSMDLAQLFVEGISTTGSGYGLAIVGDFVTNAYGLKDTREALERGYLGASLLGSAFAAWFHWPRVCEQ